MGLGSRLLDLFRQYETTRQLLHTASMHVRPLNIWDITRYRKLVNEERRLAEQLGRTLYTEVMAEAEEAVRIKNRRCCE